jgi:hypothetical protein
MKWWERVSYLLVIGIMGLFAIMYTNNAIAKNNAVVCPLYSILDRPIPQKASPDTVAVYGAIHDARVKFDCPPPLIKKR